MKKFFRECKKTIKAAFANIGLNPEDPEDRSREGVDIEFVNDCEFWNPILDWSRSHYQRLADKDGIPLSLKREEIVTDKLETIDDRVWVESAFDMLANYLDDDEADELCPFQYLVIVFDNLDQSPLEVQKTAVQLVGEYLLEYPKPTFWQIYFPFWEESYDRLMAEINTPPLVEEIRLEPPDLEDLIGSISNEVTSEIDDDDPEKRQFTVNYIRDAMVNARLEFLELINDLGAYDCRRKIAMWRSTISSQALYEHYRKTKEKGEPGFDQVSNYALVDGMLTSTTGFHNRSEKKNPVANLFYPILPTRSPREVLVALHLLSVFSRYKTEISKVRVEEMMGGLGYSLDTIVSGLLYLKKFGIVRFFNEEAFDAIIIKDRVVGGYERLIKMNAYLDNMAMVSPVVTTSGFKKTNSYDTNLLYDRIQTTWRFLMMLRLDERLFCSSTQASWIQSDEDRQRFDRHLRRSEVPSFSRSCGLAYVEQLKTLKEIRGKVLTDRQWDDVIERPEVKELKALPETLSVGWDENSRRYVVN